MERWLSSERNVRICAMLGAVAIAFSSIVVRLSHASPSTAAIFRCAYALPFLGLIMWLEDRRYGSRAWADRKWAIASGVFCAAAAPISAARRVRCSTPPPLPLS